jgi:hypothetical protein
VARIYGLERRILARRGDDGDVGHSGHLGGHGVHDQAGNERGFATLAAGHVQAHAVHGAHHLPEHGAVGAGGEPGLFGLPCMEVAHAGDGLAQDVQVGRGHAFEGSRNVAVGNAEAAGQIWGVEAARVVAQGCIAALLHIGEDVAHARGDVISGILASGKPGEQGVHVHLGGNAQDAAGHVEPLDSVWDE